MRRFSHFNKAPRERYNPPVPDPSRTLKLPPMILARYLLLQLTGPFLFGLSLFSGVLLLDKLFDVVDLLVNKGVSLFLSVRIFALFLPTVLSLSVPMSLLLACLLAFGRLSEDNEVTALRASGVSFIQILGPPLALAAVLSDFLIPFNTRWAPRSMSGFRSLYHEIAQQDPLVKIEPGQFTAIRNIRLFAAQVDRNQNGLRRVWIYQYLEGFTQRIYAEAGAARTDARSFTLDLRDGQIERTSNTQPRDLVHIRFKRYTLQVPFLEAGDDHQKSWRERTSAELEEEMRPPPAGGHPRRRRAGGVPPPLRHGLRAPGADPAGNLLGHDARARRAGRRLRRGGGRPVHVLPALDPRPGPGPAGGHASHPRPVDGEPGVPRRGRRPLPQARPPMTKLGRYILAAFLRPLMAGTGALVVLVMLGDLFERLDKFFVGKASPRLVAEHLLALLPLRMTDILPVAALLAALLSLGELSQRKELIAAMGGGIHPWRCVRSLLWSGVLLSLFCLGLGEYVTPPAARRAREIWNDDVRHITTRRETQFEGVTAAGRGEFSIAR